MLRTVSAAALGLAALTASPALALGSRAVIAHIPFAFNVGSVTLPAGDYRIKPASNINRDLLEIVGQDRRHAVVALTVEGAVEPRDAKPELVFDRYGNQRFLHAVQVSEEPSAILLPSRSELQTARELAARRPGSPASSK